MNKIMQNEIGTWIARLNAGEVQIPENFFWRPVHFVTLALALKTGRVQAARLPNSTVNYVARMGLWQAIGQVSPINMECFDSTGRFRELASIRTRHDAENTTEHLLSIAKEKGEIDTETINSLGYVLAELLNNCLDHAEPEMDIYGMVCAQAWSRGNLAQIAIADAGVGIRKTLSANFDLHKRLSSENACELAVEYAATGKPGKGHSGYGLTLANDILKINQGNLLLISGREYFQSCESRKRCGSFPNSQWDGTIIVFEWNLDKPLDVGSVYASWPVSEGFDDDDFDNIF